MLRLAVGLLFASSVSALAATAKASFQVGLIITEKHAAPTAKPKASGQRVDPREGAALFRADSDKAYRGP